MLCTRIISIAFLLCTCIISIACNPPPFGETVIVVDTDVGVPTFASRLRIDLFAPDGTWFQSRDVVTPTPDDWPVSFSVYTDGPDDRVSRVRLRAYPDGATRDYRGEQFAPPPPFVEPTFATSISQLCQSAPILPRAKNITLRHGPTPLTTIIPQSDCTAPTNTGSVAVEVFIPSTDTYRFEVVSATPDGSEGLFPGDTTLVVRSDCPSPSSQLACNDDIDAIRPDLLSSVTTQLSPGIYWLVTGGRYSGVADLTLRWDFADQWDADLAQSATPAPADDGPFLDGAPTPTTEPQPNLAIDRLFDARARFGRQQTIHVLLSGECLGTQADLAGAASCIDTAGERDPIVELDAVDGIDHGGASVAGSWSGEQIVPCANAPRAPTRAADGTSNLDGTVCIPGGAFTLGDRRVVGAAQFNATPQQVAIVPPFFLDQNELSVARYRDALAHGFVSPDATPMVNDGPLDPTTPDDSIHTGACTFSTTPRGRERMPLNCLSWFAARALCQFYGADLPGHAAWEYAAVAAGRAQQVEFPTGVNEPGCCDAVYGRGFAGNECAPPAKSSECEFGLGPVEVDAMPWASRDMTPTGVIGMSGSMLEWALDSARPYTDACWWQRPLRDVGCHEMNATEREARGGAWPANLIDTRAAQRHAPPPTSWSIVAGVRCAWGDQ